MPLGAPLQYVVTGASRGIGLEFARQLAARGDDVLATARDPDASRELHATGAQVARLDVTDPQSVKALARLLDGRAVDCLVNNAGVGGANAPFERLDWADVAKAFDTNAIGPMRVTQALLPGLRRGQRRLVASVTSRMGSIADNESGGHHAYRASKCALNMLSRSLSVDLRREGFTCLVLHPGWVATSMGGPNAPLTAAESVAGLLRVLDRATRSQSGRFFDYRGEEIPW